VSNPRKSLKVSELPLGAPPCSRAFQQSQVHNKGHFGLGDLTVTNHGTMSLSSLSLSLSLTPTHNEPHESSGRECQNLVFRNFIPIVARNLPQFNQNHNEILVYIPVTDTRRQTKPSSLHHFYALSVS